MTPTFNYIKDPDAGNRESVVIQVKEQLPENKEPEKKIKVKRKKVGSSLGWGWFQGFNLFVTACFLLVLLVLAYFIVGSDDRHEGLSKYVLDQSSDSGMAIVNPQLPLDVQKSFVYVAPKKRPKEEPKPELGEIKLLSAVEPEKKTVDEDLPKLELVSSPDHETAFFGEPFGMSKETLKLESLNESGTTFNAVADKEVDHLNDIAREAMRNGHLIEPYEGSALEAYQKILSQSPNHQLGLSGLNELATIYLRRADSSINLRNFPDALKNVELGLKADPSHAQLNKLKSEIQAFLE